MYFCYVQFFFPLDYTNSVNHTLSRTLVIDRSMYILTVNAKTGSTREARSGEYLAPYQKRAPPPNILQNQ